MSLPTRVQAQLDEADRLEALLTQQTPTDDSQAQTDTAQEQPAPVPVQPEPAATPAEPSEETWQKRYKTLQGKFNAEVPRFSQQIRELNQQLAEAQAKIAELAKAPAPVAKGPSLVTDKDIEAFGGDLVDLVKRQAQEVAEQLAETRLASLAEENKQLRKTLDTVADRQVVTDREKYFTQLGSLVADYEELNVDEGFLAWLAEADPMSGMARQEFLNTAFNSFDVVRTANLFNAYKGTLAPQAAVARTTNRTLERQVTPGTSKVNGPTEAQPDTRIWKQSEIAQFYADITKGLYKGRDADQARIEAQIDQAVADGRVA
jgi:archaellum component FlaC